MSENKFIRGILPKEFALNRSHELYNLIQRVKHTSSSRLPTQKLPCHLRRRSASHKPYKLPLRRVGKGTRRDKSNVCNMYTGAAVVKKRKKSSRIKHLYSKRRRRLYRMEYLKKSLLSRSKRLQKFDYMDGNKFLPLTTHLYHAKRFRMAKYTNWIYSIPLSCMFKTYRPSCRALLGYSVLLDMSYLAQFQIASNHNDMIKWFNEHTDISVGNEIDSKICRDGFCEGETILYMDSDSYNRRQLIGPIKYSVSPAYFNPTKLQELCTLWIWSHPTCVKPIDELLSGAKLSSYELLSVQHKFNRYRLIGPQSLEILFSTLLACTSQLLTSSIDKIDDDKIDDGKIDDNKIDDNKIDDDKIDDKFFQAGKLWNNRENDGRMVYNLLVQLSLFKKPKSTHIKQIATTFKRIRSRQYRSDNFPNDMIDFHTSFKNIAKINDQKYIPVSIVLTQPFNRLQDHVDIIVRDSRGGRRLWNALLNREVCVGGLRELQTYHYSHQQPLFPFDYPDSYVYHQSTFDFYASECMKLGKNERLPPPKRINFTKLRQIEQETLLFCHRKWIGQWKLVSLEYIENSFLSIPSHFVSTHILANSLSENNNLLKVCRNGLVLKCLSNYFSGKLDSQSTMKALEGQRDPSSTLIFVNFNHMNLRGCPKPLATIHLPTYKILQKSFTNDNTNNIVDRDFRTFDNYVKNQFSIDMNWPFVIIGQCTAGSYSYRFGYSIAQGFISLKALLYMIELKLKPTTIYNNNNYRNAVLLRNRGSDRYFRSHFSIPLPSYQL